MPREGSGGLLNLQSFSFDDFEHRRGDEASGDHIFDALLNSHRNFSEFFKWGEDQKSGCGIRHGWHEHVEHVFPGDPLNFSAGLAGHKPDGQKAPARELEQDDFAKG